MVKVLIMGSKEYPMGINKGYDLPSGGMEVYTENIVKYLKKDFDITIISAWFPGSKKYEKIGGVEVYRVKRIPGRLIRGITFPLTSFFKALTLDFDAVISNGPISSFFAYLLSKIKRKRYIALPHGFASEQKEIPKVFRLLLTMFIEKTAFKKADATVFVSDNEFKKYNSLLGAIKNPIIIEQGVEFEKFSRIKRKKQKEKTILFVGRLLPVKGVEYLIKALPLIKKDYVCIIVGDGQDREKLEALSKELKVNVVFTGFKNDIRPYLSRADVFVLPSLSEAYGIVNLEAMAAKVPVVVSKLDIPITKEQAMIVPKKNPKLIASAVNELFVNKELRESLVKKGYEFSKRRSFEKVSKELKKVIEELL